MLAAKKYSDDKKKFRSLDQIVCELPEQNYYLQHSQIYIYRYEDVIFSVFPHMASLKRRGNTNIKEIFANNDPFTGKPLAAPGTVQPSPSPMGTEYDNQVS